MAILGKTGAAGQRKYVDLYILDKSQTWSPRQDCKAIITVVGGGGAGASRYATSDSQSLGGGAGGLAQSSELTLSSSTSYTVVAGAGGAASVADTSPAPSGGQSSFTDGISINLVANGGEGGVFVAASRGNGSAGGTASGGTYNYTGGQSGWSIFTPGQHQATGGGAVNITGTAYNGGLLEGNDHMASGGAGCGENGGSTLGINHSSSRGGKGCIDHIIDFYYLLPTAYNSPTNSAGALANYYPATGYVNSYSRSDTPAPMFCGGYGVSSYGVAYQEANAQGGGWFAGGGGVTCGNNTGSNKSGAGGNGGFPGGGGGGANFGATDSHLVYGGAGGDGCVFIAVTEYL